MKRKPTKKRKTDAKYYDKHGALSSIVEGEVAISPDDVLKWEIISGKRKRKCGSGSEKRMIAAMRLTTATDTNADWGEVERSVMKKHAG